MPSGEVGIPGAARQRVVKVDVKKSSVAIDSGHNAETGSKLRGVQIQLRMSAGR